MVGSGTDSGGRRQEGGHSRLPGVDWTILRPATLIDDPGTGRIRVGTGLPLGSIPRADVAALLARLLIHSDGLRRQFEVTSGAEDLTTVPL